MEYNKSKKEIILNRELSKLDNFVIEFINILKKYSDYVIISGYISILLGRSRATENVDLFIKEMTFQTFVTFYEDLKKNGFWCLNADEARDILIICRIN